MARVLVTGSASYDALIQVGEFFAPRPGTVFSKSYHEVVGGTGAGKALALSRLFDQTVFHCFVGDDPAGRLIRQRFAQERLTLLAETDPAGTEHHVNIMNDRGERISIYARYATFEPEFQPESLESEIAAADRLVLNIINYCRRLIPLARKHGKEIWCDIHDYDGQNPYHDDFIAAADWLFMSSEGMADWRGFMKRMIAAGKKAVVCTHGRGGSTLLDARDRFFELPAIEAYERVDTNGAGDCFMSGFLYGHARGRSLEDCQKLATICGGLSVSSRELVHAALSVDFLEAEYLRHYGG
jgi:sugar/nucleoside kinase (ribokinase family)